MEEAQLRKLYLERKMSMMDIAHFLGCSVHKVTYWLQSYDIPRRTRSEAIYVKNNGLTDPFQIASLDTEFKQKLYGMGVGIFWGEGNKKCTTAVRMGNTDIDLS